MTGQKPEAGSRRPEFGGRKPAETQRPDTALPFERQAPVVLLAMCVFGEARGEPLAVQQAVAQVVLNRAGHPHIVFGSRRDSTLEENIRWVVLQRKQFSCFNPYDPNYPKILRPLKHERPEVWERCLRVAETALAENQPPLAGARGSDLLTENSDHYFDDSIEPPKWAAPEKRTVKIGRLNFYRLYLPEISSQESVVRSQESVVSSRKSEVGGQA